MGRGGGANYTADSKSKPDGQTLKSKTTPQPADNKNQVQSLKSNSGIRSWNKLSENPPKALLNDPDIRRWHDNLRRSSTITCSVRLRRLNLFCSRVGVTPHELASMGRDDPMKVENILLDHVSWMEEKKYAPGYITGVIGAVKSWLEYNHIEIRRKIKIANSDVPVSIQDEKVPDNKQLKKMLDAADPRCRVIISMLAFAGVRPQVMGLADKSDGLILSDLPDLILDGQQDTRFEKTPAMVVVRPHLSKIRKKYFTFLAEEGCQYVLGYLRERMARGERLKPNSPLVTLDHGYRLKGWAKIDGDNRKFMVTNALGAAIRPVIRSVMKARPYALRAYFDTQLLIAESHGLMTHAYRQFFMGHKGDMEARYTTNKGKLTDQMTEDMRRAYEQSQQFLSTDGMHDTESDKHKMLVGMWRQQAKMYGLDIYAMLTNDAVDKMQDDTCTPQKTIPAKQSSSSSAAEHHNHNDMIPSVMPLKSTLHATGAGKKAAAVQTADVALTATINDDTSRPCPFESRILDNDAELLACTAEGWDLVKDLPGERFLVRRKIPTFFGRAIHYHKEQIPSTVKYPLEENTND